MLTLATAVNSEWCYRSSVRVFVLIERVRARALRFRNWLSATVVGWARVIARASTTRELSSTGMFFLKLSALFDFRLDRFFQLHYYFAFFLRSITRQKLSRSKLCACVLFMCLFLHFSFPHTAGTVCVTSYSMCFSLYWCINKICLRSWTTLTMYQKGITVK